MKSTQKSALAAIPAVDELLKQGEAAGLLASHPRSSVIDAIRETLAEVRSRLRQGESVDLRSEALIPEIRRRVLQAEAYSLQPLINATGIVLHTNLGRATLSDRAIRNMAAVGSGYTNLEYDLEAGMRGKRHVHLKRLLVRLTGAEDALVVNNNAAAVFLCLNTIARCREVIVSRGELVEIGGSFRVPDVMAASGAQLREVGTTNKTHLRDYEGAIGDTTGMLLKVHQSNYRMIGFTEEVPIADLVALGRKKGIPVMFDLGSGCLVDFRPYGVLTEPTVQEMVTAGVDLITFSGDKLLGGPQGGLIVGRKDLISRLQKNPMARAFRIDKLTIAAFEATLAAYAEPEQAGKEIPVLAMLFQPAEKIHRRALRIASALRRSLPGIRPRVLRDASQAGGGSLPETSWPTSVVAIGPEALSVNEFEERLRKGVPPVIARIRNDRLLLDARTIADREIPVLIERVAAALQTSPSS